MSTESDRGRTTYAGGPVEPVPADALVARAEALAGPLWAEAAAIDAGRRLTDRAVEGITTAGLPRLMAPRSHGGHEACAATALDVVTALGRGCASTAWVTGVYASGAFVAGLFGEAARDEVWGGPRAVGGHPDARVALVLVPPRATVEELADGGLRLAGTWRYASGSLHADWFGLLVPVPVEGGMRMQVVLVPRDEVTVEDTWHVTGMRGTGTNTVVLHDVVVPGHRVQPWSPLLEGERPHARAEGTLQHSSLSGLLQVLLLGALIGEARSALELVVEAAPARPIAGSTYARALDSTSFQVDVADAASQIDAAAMHAERIARVVDADAAAGPVATLDTVTRARMRMDAAAAVRGVREAVDRLMTAHGTSAFAEASPMQRIWRNTAVGSRHGGFGAHVPEEVYGRALLDLDPRATSPLL